MQIRYWAGFGILALALAGCGETPLEQALYGAGAGAGSALILAGDAGTGAVLGAVGNLAYCQTYPQRC